jgi:hypothetical protein
MQRTRITHSQSDRTLASTSELEASQTKHTQGQHIPKVLNLSQGRAPPLFIAPKPNRTVGAKYPFSTRALDRVEPDIGHGGAPPNGQIPKGH